MATTKRQSGRRQPTPPERKASEKTMDPLPGLAVAESPQPKIVETTTEATPETELAQQAATSNSVTKASAPIIPQELAAKIRVSRKRVKDAAIALIAERVAYGNYLIEVRKLKFPHGTWLDALENELGIPEKEARWATDLAKNAVTANPSNWPHLPRASSAAHEVTRMPSEIAQELVDSGDINPKTSANRIKQLGTARVGPTKSRTKRRPFKPPTKSWHSPTKSRMTVFFKTMELVRGALNDADALGQFAANLVEEYDHIRREGWWQ